MPTKGRAALVFRVTPKVLATLKAMRAQIDRDIAMLESRQATPAPTIRPTRRRRP